MPGGIFSIMQTMRSARARRLPNAYGGIMKRPDDELTASWVAPALRDAEIRRQAGEILKGFSKRHTLAAAARFGEFEKPVLIAWAPEDRFFALADAERLARDFPDARLELIEDSYTLVSLDQPGPHRGADRGLCARAGARARSQPAGLRPPAAAARPQRGAGAYPRPAPLACVSPLELIFWHAIILAVAVIEQVRTPAVEDYSKAIFALESRGEEPVSTNALAERLGVTAGSVSAMLRKLDELGPDHARPLPRRAPDRRRAAHGARGHPPPPAARELPLAGARDALGPRPRRGRGARARPLGGPRGTDRRQARPPHGRPPRRPDPERRPRARRGRTERLESLQPGDRGVFVRVSDSDPEMLRYLAERGIAPGARLSVRDRQPFGGPLFVRFGESARNTRSAGASRARCASCAKSRSSRSAEPADEAVRR